MFKILVRPTIRYKCENRVYVRKTKLMMEDVDKKRSFLQHYTVIRIMFHNRELTSNPCLPLYTYFAFPSIYFT